MEYLTRFKQLIFSRIINKAYSQSIDSAKIYDFIFISSRNGKLSANQELFQKFIETKEYSMKLLKVEKTQGSLKRTKQSIDIVKEINRGKYIILDDFVYPINVLSKIDDSHKIIQFWHALGAFKKVGIKSKHRNYDMVFLNDLRDAQYYKDVFESKKFYGLGMLRSKLYVDTEVRPRNEKITKVLYVPTYRENNSDFCERYLNNIVSSLSKEYDVTLSLHPYVDIDLINQDLRNKVNIIQTEPELLHSLSEYDVLITDYSSIIFDYSYFERPIIHYVPDHLQYTKDFNFFRSIDDFGLTVCNEADAVMTVLSNEKLMEANVVNVKKIKEETFDGKVYDNLEQDILDIIQNPQ